MRWLNWLGYQWEVALLTEKAAALQPQERLSERYLYLLAGKLATELPEGWELAAVKDKLILTCHFDMLDLSTLDELSKMQLIEIDDLPVQHHEVPVCYTLGVDLPELEERFNRDRREIIELHINAEYRIALIGFLPGFVYLDGLPKELQIPRKEIPRRVEGGSVGIAGDQSGIYSLASPGGWSIIGLTPVRFMLEDSDLILPGDYLKFVEISVDEFQAYG